MFIPIAFLMKVPLVGACVATGVILAWITLMLTAAGYFKAARIYFLVITQGFLSALLIFMSGRDGGTQIVYIMSASLHLVLFKDTKWSVAVFLMVMLLFGITSYIAEHTVSYVDGLTAYQKRFSYYLNIASCAALVFAMILYFKNAASEYEAKINEQNRKISEKNKDILDSIKYAQRIQQSLLPSEKLVERSIQRSKNNTAQTPLDQVQLQQRNQG
jgi:hypothetical protein